MRAYKLVRIKNGKLYPLFIGRKKETNIGEWLHAECIPTKGFAVRTGFHCCFLPFAPHLKTNLANGEKEYGLSAMLRILQLMIDQKAREVLGF